MLKIKLRFAPSLTGELHVGNLASLCYNFWFRLASGGTLVWRVDGYSNVTQVRTLRKQLLLATRYQVRFDSLHVLLASRSRYEDYITDLGDLVYPSHDRALPGVIHRRSTESDDMAANVKQCYRLDIVALQKRLKLEFWVDGFGRKIDLSCLKHMSDPVVISSTGQLTYVLSSILWDLRHDVSHVIRGEDLANTAPIHWMVGRYFGKDIKYMHHGLLSWEKAKISKSRGGVLLLDPERYLRLYGPLLWHWWVANHTLREPLRSVEAFDPTTMLTRGLKEVRPESLEAWSSTNLRRLSWRSLNRYGSSAVAVRRWWRELGGNCRCLEDWATWVRWLQGREHSGYSPSTEFRRELRRLLANDRNSPPTQWLLKELGKDRVCRILEDVYGEVK